MSLRIATREDIPTLLRIMQDPDVRPFIGMTEADDDWLAVTLGQRFDHFAFLIRDDSAGFFQLEVIDGKPTDVFVHACALRGARGRSFMDNARELERVASSLGVERMWSYTTTENRRARVFAALCGLKPCDPPGDWCAWMYEPDEGVWMQKTIKSEVQAWVPQQV